MRWGIVTIVTELYLYRNNRNNRNMEKICLNCEAPFVSNSEKKKFCSDKCRVVYSRKLKGGKITPEVVSENVKIIEAAWITEVREFCDKQGIIPQDLIDTWKRSGINSKIVGNKSIEDKVEKSGRGGYDLFKIKMGIK